MVNARKSLSKTIFYFLTLFLNLPKPIYCLSKLSVTHSKHSPKEMNLIKIMPTLHLYLNHFSLNSLSLFPLFKKTYPYITLKNY
jgi:hypothetical protein